MFQVQFSQDLSQKLWLFSDGLIYAVIATMMRDNLLKQWKHSSFLKCKCDWITFQDCDAALQKSKGWSQWNLLNFSCWLWREPIWAPVYCRIVIQLHTWFQQTFIADIGGTTAPTRSFNTVKVTVWMEHKLNEVWVYFLQWTSGDLERKDSSQIY